MENRTGLFANIIIWFGVAISVSEIEAGISIGTANSINSLWLPLVLGHIVGGILLYYVGLIGAKTRLNAMETIISAFGKKGSKFFAILNVSQLIAWVAVLNAQGALALTGLNIPVPFALICIFLSILIAIWVYVGFQRSSKMATGVMVLLTILLLLLSFKLFGMINPNITLSSSSLTFWNIFEISIAMPISWLPVISDYTKDVEKPVKATAISAIAYTLASLWMYVIGIEIANIGVNIGISQSILLAGFGIPGILILVISTVTSNFIAANSAGESAKAIYSKLNPKTVGVVVSGISAILAISGIMDHYINFLYLIASVFAPMAAVLLVSYFLVGTTQNDNKLKYWNLFSWLIGFIVYQIANYMDSIFLGPTLLAVIVSAVLAYIGFLIQKHWRK
ncbi:MAG: cytosine permease [Methanosphaera stadtmanae]|nr:cytosine permease [Methanosphaera stadtmanae]